VFGAIPDEGARFEVTYRVGGGIRGNVAADAIDRVDPADPLAPNIALIGNPFAAAGGADEEPDDRVRDLAPQAFRARQFRAVLPADYDRAVTTELDWSQRAGTSFRWTGSWLSVFTAVDPKASEDLPVDRLIELSALLNRYRLAGYEAFPRAPRYASLDLEVTVCARPEAFRGDVKEGVLRALDTRAHTDGTRGFFHPDRFTFGLPLERSELEAAVQEVPGVDGVVRLRYRRRGFTPGYIDMLDEVDVASDEIVRVDNDPSRPERGSLQIYVQGGK
jgi:predicted phage baseplate assembly protein